MNSSGVEWVLENNQVIVFTNSVEEVNGANSLVQFIAVVASSESSRQLDPFICLLPHVNGAA